MEIYTAAHCDYDHISDWRNVNPEIERSCQRLAVEHQFGTLAAAKSFFRVQVLTVRRPYRRAPLVWRRLAVGDQHPGPLPPRIIPHERIVLAIGTERQFANVPVSTEGWADGLAVIHKAPVS